jgi:Flp pilus assembly secretin CpaC
MMKSNMRRCARWSVSVAAALLAAAAAVSSARADAEVLTVVLDQAMLVKLPDQIATLVVGNPLIAEASLQVGGTLVITGKGYGSTNMLALDRNGNILMEKIVQVQAPKEAVIVYRGIERQTFSCTPTCERQVMLGDSEAAFTAALAQATARNTQAQAAAR